MNLLVAIGAAGLGTGLLAYAAWLWWSLRRPIRTQHTREDVWADVDITRGCRRLRQAIDDHDQVWAIWPDAAKAARIAEAQHRLDQHRKENQ